MNNQPTEQGIKLLVLLCELNIIFMDTLFCKKWGLHVRQKKLLVERQQFPNLCNNSGCA